MTHFSTHFQCRIISRWRVACFVALCTILLLSTIPVKAAPLTPTFNTGTFFPASGSPTDVAIADLDGDGKADLVASDQYANIIAILRNTNTTNTISTSSFGTPLLFTTGNSPQRLTLGDLDGDGKQEIVTANYNDNTVSIFRNTSTSGNIALAARVDFLTDLNPSGVAVGDLDGDGKQDLVVVNIGSNTVIILRNTSTGAGNIAFAAKVTIGSFTQYGAAVAQPSGVDLGDMDGDNKLDIVTANYGGQGPSTVNAIFRNTTSTIGNITFAAPVTVSAPSGPFYVKIADLDLDGKLDFVSSKPFSGGRFYLYRNTSSGPGNIAFAPIVILGIGGGTQWFALSDLNKDSRPELVIQRTIAVQVYVNNTTAPGIDTTSFTYANFNASQVNGLSGIAVGDLDGNGAPEIAAGTGGGIVVYHNTTPAPEIDVRGNSVSIVSGGNTPSASDHTDFGNANVNSGTVVRTFTIQNTGNAALSVSTPTLSGANAGDFSVTSLPASSVATNGSTTFQITFDPSAAGMRTATVSIGNNDSNENPYTFAIQGTGDQPSLDADNDGIADASDNCPTVANADQRNSDNDAQGNACDTDDDNDGVADVNDAFPLDVNESVDTDGDGIGNNADPDDDNDGVADANDAFPLDANESVDTDGDGIGNNADPDDDNDGVADANDAFPLDAAESVDTDSDGIGNNADPDDDNDSVADINDAFPVNATESVDTDGDGIGNNADPDDDNDSVADANDAFPLNAAESVDTDGDGTGNNADTDDDNDGVADINDAFPLNATESVDTDGDGIGNNADPDDDNDSVADANDAFPLNASESVDSDHDSIGNNGDPDDDNDGVNDTVDAFPLNPAESVDTDHDGIGNNADPDDDNDGVNDNVDAFPLNPAESLDTDGDGIGNNADADDDNDGVPDAQDPFPTTRDTIPPVITLAAGSITLWPPNHQYVTIPIANLVLSATDATDSQVSRNRVVITKVTSDEVEDAADEGDGNTLNDMVIAADGKAVDLRAERQGGGNGRVHTIQVQVSDRGGNTTTATFKVQVPKSQGKSQAVDDGPVYTVTRSVSSVAAASMDSGSLTSQADAVEQASQTNRVFLPVIAR